MSLFPSFLKRGRRPASLVALLLAVTAVHAASPPLVNLRFEDEPGFTAANSGTLAGQADLVVTEDWPVFSTSVPTGPFTPSDNQGSLDFGSIAAGQGGRALDLIAGDGTLGFFNAFTIAGWVNARDLREGGGGNRLAFALSEPNGSGFDLVQLSNGALRIGINQWPDGANGGGPSSSPGKITADPEVGSNNWVFVAVTYDPTLATGQLKYYFGRSDALVQLDSAHTYLGGVDNGGSIDFTGPLTLGNFGVVVGARGETGPDGGSRVFRGLMDEWRIYDTALGLEDLQGAQLNGQAPPVAVAISTPPASQTVFVGENATFQVEVTGSAPYTFQWWRGDEPIGGATEQTYTLVGVTAADHGAEFSVRATNSVGNAASSPAQLIVLSDTGPRAAFSFSEAAGNSITNNGSLGGRGGLVERNGAPEFSAKVPTGPFAPTENTASIDFGSIADGQGGQAIDLAQALKPDLGSLESFTVTGWLNARDLTEGWGGNRIAFALATPNGAGFDLVQTASGALRIGVNQWPDGANGGGPFSTEGRITADPDTGEVNWVFFAVTYDSTIDFGNINYYFGSPTTAAELDVTADYPQSVLSATGPLTLGNFSTVVSARNETGPAGGSRVFRGLMDEVKVFARALSLDEIRAAQTAAAIGVPPEPITILRHPADLTVFAGQTAAFDLELSGTGPISYQWLRNGAPVDGATGSSYTLADSAVSDDQALFSVAVTNTLGGTVSTAARLTVLPEDHRKVYLPFAEGSGTTSANQGNLRGGVTLAVTAAGVPAFSSNVPTGPFAPTGNTSSLDLGSIEEGQGGQAADLVTDFYGGSLGQLSAFTIAGWVNARSLQEGPGGNRIAFALATPGGPGFDLVLVGDGSLRLGINQWPDAAGGGPFSSWGRITEDPEASPANWVFFAATYDSSLEAGHLTYYFGTAEVEANIDVTSDYPRGPITTSGRLTVGNFGSVVGARGDLGASSRVFRGLVDELWLLNEAIGLDAVRELQKAAAPEVPPTLTAQLDGDELLLAWPDGGTPFVLQSRTALNSGSWEDPGVDIITEGGQKTARVPVQGTSQYFRLNAP